MPLYDYECQVCGAAKAEFRSVATRNECPGCDLCKAPMVKIISGYAVHGDMDYFDENLGVQIKSRKHRERVMKEQGVTEKFGQNWVTAASSKQRKRGCRV